MKIVWICGLPNMIRESACDRPLSSVQTAAWSWILGHLPPPPGIELHILCPVLRLEAEYVTFTKLGVRWHCFRQENHELLFLWRRVYKKMRRIVDDINPDIIHGWGGETGCGYLATLLSNHAVVGVQGLLLLYAELCKDKRQPKFSMKRWLHVTIEKMSYARACILFTESNLSREALKRYYGQESVVIPHPLRNAFFNSQIKKSVTQDGTVNFLFVGSLCQRKGIMDALQAFKDLNVENSRLVVVGDGELYGSVAEYIKREGLDGRVVLKQHFAAGEIVETMGDMQFFLLPSYGDTGPTALKEALSQGLYPICYDNSGPRELIHRYYGSLVNTGDIKGLVAVMSSLISNLGSINDERIAIVNKVRSDLSKEAVWRKLLTVYASIGNEECIRGA